MNRRRKKTAKLLQQTEVSVDESRKTTRRKPKKKTRSPASQLRMVKDSQMVEEILPIKTDDYHSHDVDNIETDPELVSSYVIDQQLSNLGLIQFKCYSTKRKGRSLATLIKCRDDAYSNPFFVYLNQSGTISKDVNKQHMTEMSDECPDLKQTFNRLKRFKGLIGVVYLSSTHLRFYREDSHDEQESNYELITEFKVESHVEDGVFFPLVELTEILRSKKRILDSIRSATHYLRNRITSDIIGSLDNLSQKILSLMNQRKMITKAVTDIKNNLAEYKKVDHMLTEDGTGWFTKKFDRSKLLAQQTCSETNLFNKIPHLQKIDELVRQVEDLKLAFGETISQFSLPNPSDDIETYRTHS